MDWLNLHVSILDSPEVLRCDPVRRATWLFLLRYCIGQENGGVILDCSEWGDTTWQQLVRVKLREVKATSSLWTWDGNRLVVAFYPTEKEAEIQAKRDTARTNGKSGGRPKRTNIATNHKPTLVNSPKAEGNGRGMEGEGEGRNQTQPPPPPPQQDLFGPDQPAPPPIKMARSFGDWQAQHGRVHVGREEREAWTATFRLWGWDGMSEAYRETAKTITDPKHRVLLSMVTKYLDDHFHPPKEAQA